jgi:plasmid stabilization system protein ParE
MDYSITWSQLALGDLNDLVTFIAQDNVTAARKLGNRIINKVGAISSFPEIGRVVPEFKCETIREILTKPYRIVYELDHETHTLAVLRIWHNSRMPLVGWDI